MSLTQEDRTDICFRDPHYLERFGGGIPSAGNALEYLSLAPEFYTSSCINEQVKMQTRYNSLDQSSLDVSKMSGVEYYTWYSDVPGQVFHLLKQYKYSNTFAKPMAAYYILQGNIYQAPDLRALLASRLRTCLHHLTAAYEEYSSHVQFHPAQGYVWNISTNSTAQENETSRSSKRPLKESKKRAKKKTLVKLHVDTSSSSLNEDDSDSLIESPVEKDLHLFSARFVNRVDTLIAESAQKQHVVLVEKPPPPEMKPPNPTTRTKESIMTASSFTGKKDSEEASVSESLLGAPSLKKKRPKKELDFQSDSASLGGESTKSRKKKKMKKEKLIKSPSTTI